MSTAELLDAWERGLREPPLRKPLALLSGACECGIDELARLPIGERDALLIDLREWTFGPDLAATIVCPGCDDRLELGLTTTVLRRAHPACAELAFEAGGYRLRLRLPHTLDLEACTAQGEPESARRELLARCLTEVARGDEVLALLALPPRLADECEARMAEADPQADIELALTCPNCGHGFPALLDMGAFFWSEVNAWANRTLDEIDQLAREYGWSEPEILAMSPQRRQSYLERLRR